MEAEFDGSRHYMETELSRTRDDLDKMRDKFRRWMQWSDWQRPFNHDATVIHITTEILLWLSFDMGDIEQQQQQQRCQSKPWRDKT